MTVYIISGIAAVLAAWVIFSFNRFIVLINKSKEAWADIDVQLKRRHDLVPNLVNTVKGYATHEKEAFESITKARTNAIGAQNIEDKGRTENMLSGALKTVFAVAEAYPDLKANQNFLALQKDLVEVEDKIQYARRYYNGNVRDLNISVDSFPGNIIAGIFHFAKMEFFTLDEPGEKNPSEVKF